MKKIIINVLLATMVLGLAGCGNASLSDNSALSQNEAVSDNAISSDAVSEDSVSANEEELSLELTVSDWTYSDLNYINQNYLIACEDNGLWYPIDYDGNIIGNEDNNAYNEDGSRIITVDGWTGYSLGLPNGSFVVYKDKGYGKYLSVVYDNKMNEIIRAERNGYIYDYRDDLVFIQCSDHIEICYFKDGEWGKISGTFKPGQTTVAYSNGKVFMNTVNRDQETGSYSFYIDADKYKNSLATGNIEFTKVAPEYKDYDVHFLGAADEDGWILVKLTEAGAMYLSETTNESLTASENDVKASDRDYKLNPLFGFYNIQTKDFVELPEEFYTACYYTDVNGYKYLTVQDGKAIVCTAIDNNDNSIQKIYDLDSKKFVTEEYITISRDPANYILVQKPDGRWGYLDKESLEETDNWYTDASCFINGFALVNEDGKEYLVNEGFDKVIMKGTDSTVVTDGIGAKCPWNAYLKDSVIGEGLVFIVNTGEGYKLVYSK